MKETKMRQLRKAKGWSLNELSERTGISLPWLSYLDRGYEKGISDEMKHRVAAEFGVSVKSLFILRTEDEFIFFKNLTLRVPAAVRDELKEKFGRSSEELILKELEAIAKKYGLELPKTYRPTSKKK